MSALRTTNPLLTASAFSGESERRFGFTEVAAARPNTMTLQGAVNATFVLLGITVASGLGVFTFLQNQPGMVMAASLGGAVLALVLVLVISFKPQASPYVGPLIAIAEGAFAGAASIFWTRYAAGSSGTTAGALGTGLVLQAGLLTAGIAGGLLVAYKTRLIRATENFKLGVAAATMGFLFLCIATLVLSLIGIQIPYIWDNGPIGIAVAAGIVVLAALNLVLDFDFIEQGAERGLPRHMEWYAAIGVLVTLVWLYISLLRLLAKIQSRD